MRSLEQSAGRDRHAAVIQPGDGHGQQLVFVRAQGSRLLQARQAELLAALRGAGELDAQAAAVLVGGAAVVHVAAADDRPLRHHLGQAVVVQARQSTG